jgi:single-strand DNA-binding protein
MDNSVTVAGNLTREPELRYTPQGTAVATLGLAINRSFTGSDGKASTATDFVDVKAWRQLAERAAEMPIGSRVVVTGRFQQDRWEDEQGAKRSKLYIVADDVAASMKFADVKVSKPLKGQDLAATEAMVEEAEMSQAPTQALAKQAQPYSMKARLGAAPAANEVEPQAAPAKSQRKAATRGR